MREVGALLEAKPFHPTRKARNHLRMLAVANDIPPSRVDEMLDLVGLSDVRAGQAEDVLDRAWASGSAWRPRCSATRTR